MIISEINHYSKLNQKLLTKISALPLSKKGFSSIYKKNNAMLTNIEIILDRGIEILQSGYEAIPELIAESAAIDLEEVLYTSISLDEFILKKHLENNKSYPKSFPKIIYSMYCYNVIPPDINDIILAYILIHQERGKKYDANTLYKEVIANFSSNGEAFLNDEIQISNVARDLRFTISQVERELTPRIKVSQMEREPSPSDPYIIQFKHER